MLTIGYCRVSTEEQAGEGFSIEGQADKLRAYAELHDLGPLTVITDPGFSGKNTERPGLQQVLAAVQAGHVSSVLIWRLDRLSRNLGDLILLADSFLGAGVGLYSFTEQLDLTSATGRMFYNILGAFAQFYREQLAENVTMGLTQAVRQGRWVNRPKTGYDLVDGLLQPNDDADTVRRIFCLRAEGRSHREIEAATGIKYSTVRGILGSRIYIGEVQHKDQWYPGLHQPLVTIAEFEAARKGMLPARRQSSDLLSGHVRCGICGKSASTHYNRQGRLYYRCHHRGKGCGQPARAASSLLRAAVLGLDLIGSDEALQEAIRRKLRAPRPSAREGGGRGAKRPAARLAELSTKRRKLLDLYYSERITQELFAEEEKRLTSSIAAVQEEASGAAESEHIADDLAARFEEVARVLQQLDIGALWDEATDQEKRQLLKELLDSVYFFPDHLEVAVVGAPRFNMTFEEVGMRGVSTVGVGGGT